MGALRSLQTSFRFCQLSPKHASQQKKTQDHVFAFSCLFIPRFEAAPPSALPSPGGLAEAPALSEPVAAEGGGLKGGLFPPPSDQLPRVPFCPNGWISESLGGLYLPSSDERRELWQHKEAAWLLSHQSPQSSSFPVYTC